MKTHAQHVNLLGDGHGHIFKGHSLAGATRGYCTGQGSPEEQNRWDVHLSVSLSL